MPEPVPRRATYDDILALPENVVGELLGGELHVQPRPAPRHAVAATSLGALVHAGFDDKGGGEGGWWILGEPELHLGDDKVVPDIAGWRRERMPVLPETAWFELAPDWVCEVISPSTGRKDRAIKQPLYARERVPHLWLVEPIARTLEAYRLGEDGRWLLLGAYGDDDEVAIEPFESMPFSLSRLWV